MGEPKEGKAEVPSPPGWVPLGKGSIKFRGMDGIHYSLQYRNPQQRARLDREPLWVWFIVKEFIFVCIRRLRNPHMSDSNLVHIPDTI